MRSWAAVPYPCIEGFPRPAAFDRAASFVRSVGDLVPGMARGTIKLDLAGFFRPLDRADIPLIVLTNNDSRLIAAFLLHYRSLGVTRFIVVDDNSADGTREFLSQQADVDLYTSNVRYGEAYRGRLWRQMLVERYGRDRWYLNVDSDEFLFVAAARNLRHLIAILDARGIRHLPAPMLDMYPQGPVKNAIYDFVGNVMPWEIASLFDGTGYRLGADARAWNLKGGVRERCFGSGAQLMKYPLMRWEKLSRMDKSIHFPNPYWKNFAPPMGVLLHFKFFSDFFSDFQAVLTNGQHFGGGSVYRQILERISDPDGLELQCELSIPFIGTDDLIARGFIVA